MALWLVRAGEHGEYEQRFLNESKIYLTWNRLNNDLSKLDSQKELRKVMSDVYPNNSKKKNINQGGQIWAFSHRMQIGDWVVLPSKHKPAIYVAEVIGDYEYDNSAEDPYYHWRKIKWVATDILRSNFDQDLLYSFGALMTVCQIKRNDAEKRIRNMAKNNWKSSNILSPIHKKLPDNDEYETEDSISNLEELARDQIAKLIIAKFKGHGMARLVEGILRIQGYATYISSEGPDQGVDILAAQGPLGFTEPRICVQVKSGDSPLDRPTLDQLIGTMEKVQAKQGLLVSWGGFKASVDKEEVSQFFRVRLWNQQDLIDQLLMHYDKLDDELRAELPLKRIWTVANIDDEE